MAEQIQQDAQSSDELEYKEPVSSTGVREEAVRQLQEIVAAAELDAVVELASETPEEITIELSGPDAALLIGHHGQTLDALQYLLQVIVSSRNVEASRVRLTLDVEGYRQRRVENLTRYAEALASQVKQTGEEAVLEPLNAMERRIVHTALVNDPEVQTYSEGQGSDRHIVITPVLLQPAGTGDGTSV